MKRQVLKFSQWIRESEGLDDIPGFEGSKEQAGITEPFEQEKGWLKTDGWTVNTNPKYKLYAAKQDTLNLAITYELIITSQDDGTLFLSVYNFEGKYLRGGTLKKTNNKQEFLESIKAIINS